MPPSIPPVEIPDLSPVPTPSIPGLASGTFQSGPKEEFATADIYNLKSSVGENDAVITSIQQLELGVDDSMFGFKLEAGQTADFLSKSKDGLAFDKDLLTERMLGTNSEFRDSYNSLNDKLKQGALSKTYAQQKASELSCTINGTRSMVNSSNIRDVRALGNFVNKYTGTKIFSGQDSGAISGMLGSVITTSSDLGISGTFKTITETVNDNGIIGRVTRAVLPIALRNSDTKLLREISTSPAGQLINVFSPGFTQSFTRAFVYRGDRGRTLNSFEDVFHSFEKVDSQWDQMQRGPDGNSAVNLLALMGGSRDFSNLMMTGVRYWSTEQSRPGGMTPPVRVQPVYGLASVYQEVTVGDAIKRDFPMVALLSLYNNKLPRQGGNPAGMRNGNNNHIVDARLVKGSFAALLGL